MRASSTPPAASLSVTRRRSDTSPVDGASTAIRSQAAASRARSVDPQLPVRQQRKRSLSPDSQTASQAPARRPRSALPLSLQLGDFARLPMELVIQIVTHLPREDYVAWARAVLKRPPGDSPEGFAALLDFTRQLLAGADQDRAVGNLSHQLLALPDAQRDQAFLAFLNSTDSTRLIDIVRNIQIPRSIEPMDVLGVLDLRSEAGASPSPGSRRRPAWLSASADTPEGLSSESGSALDSGESEVSEAGSLDSNTAEAARLAFDEGGTIGEVARQLDIAEGSAEFDALVDVAVHGMGFEAIEKGNSPSEVAGRLGLSRSAPQFGELQRYQAERNAASS